MFTEDPTIITTPITTPTDRERLLSGFEEISQTILESLDLDRVLDTLAVQIVETGIFRSLMIALVDENQETLQVLRSVNRVLDAKDNTIKSKVSSHKMLGQSFNVKTDKGLTSATMRAGEMIVIEGWDDRYGQDSPSDYDDKISYFIPVKQRNKVLAVLATGSTFADKEAVLHRIEIMQPFLTFVAVALSNAKMYQQLLKSQTQLRETEKIKVLMETAGAAAHEINQPLQSIIGFAEILRTDPDQTNREQMLDNIMNAGMKISQILTNMQDIRQYATKAYAGDHAIVDLDQASRDPSQ
ncbi:MAG: C4-dicarboxylate-specific signal transduction histidine kinase [Candidatus Latescibacterota bacterium]|jgi:C4-dicarboxylate-specific signal transduction histidine kinase